MCENIPEHISDKVIPKAAVAETHGDEIHGEMNASIKEMSTKFTEIIHDQEMPVEQSIEVTTSSCASQVHLSPSKEQKLIQAMDQVEDVVLVKDTSDDEPISDVYVMNSITIEDFFL